MPTIHDVARKAGVSTATVSHVLNQSRFVSLGTARKVQRAMRDLHYQPNGVARSLRRKHTLTLGLIVPDSSNPFFAELARGVEDHAFERGYGVIFGSSDGNLDRELAYLHVMVEKQVEGLIYISAGKSDKNIAYLQSERIPLVFLDRALKGIQADYLTSDNFQGGFDATEHLINLGHREIGCVTGPGTIASNVARLQGYRAALKAHDLAYQSCLIAHGDYTATSGFAAAQLLLARSSPTPTAIFAFNDLMAIGCIGAVHKAGLRVPEDVAIIGFDDIVLASYASPPLTTVRQNKHEMGRMAAQIIIDRSGAVDQKKPERHILPVELIIRESTGKELRHG